MPGLVFSESGLSFQFPKSWTVFKYDEHRFYTYLSGAGLKGVDFIAINGEELILIEVKNYADRIIKENFDPMRGLRTDPEAYVDHYFQKFADTLKLLGIVEKYYNRKWWYRNIFQRFKSFFSKKEVIKTETGFWSRAIEILADVKGVKLILWLELAPQYDAKAAEEIYDYFQEQLTIKTPEKATFVLANAERPFDPIIMTRERTEKEIISPKRKGR